MLSKVTELFDSVRDADILLSVGVDHGSTHLSHSYPVGSTTAHLQASACDPDDLLLDTRYDPEDFLLNTA